MTMSNPRTCCRRGLFIAAAVFAILGAGLVAGCRKQHGSGGSGREPDGAAGEVVEVRVAPLQHRSVQRGIDLTGTLFADDEARIAAKVSGRVASTNKDLGDRVGPGEVLAQIDRTDYQLALQQHEAAVNEALSRLGLERMPESDVDVQTLPAVQRAGAQERNARARFERGKELFESDPPLISEQDYDELETSLEVASHNVKAEMLNGQFLLSQARSRAAELAIARQQLQDTEIRAPIRADNADYAVAMRMVSVGEYVTSGQAVFALVDADPIKFRADVQERFAGEVQVGQVVRVRMEAFDEDFTGRVTRLSPRIDPRSRAFVLEAEIPNAAGRLKPGSFGLGRVDTSLQDGVAMAPEAAIVTFAGVKRLFSVVDGKAVEHRIQTGVRNDGLIEIVGGDLPADAMLVVEGAQRLVNGQGVRVTAGERP